MKLKTDFVAILGYLLRVKTRLWVLGMVPAFASLHDRSHVSFLVYTTNCCFAKGRSLEICTMRHICHSFLMGYLAPREVTHKEEIVQWELR